MLEPLLGSISKERVLVFIVARGQGYAREIAEFFATGVTPINNQLTALEAQNVLYGETLGKTRIYKLNPRYAFIKPLTELMETAIKYYPPEQQEELKTNRRRPRRAGKPL